MKDPTNRLDRPRNTALPSEGRRGKIAALSLAATLALGLPAASLGQLAKAGNPSYNFGEQQLAAASPAIVTVQFTVSSYTGAFTPTASLQYGKSFAAGAVACTSLTDASETCSVPVTFNPQFPGARRDALYLMNGATRLAGTFLYGIGKAPFALLQPGTFSTLQLPSAPSIYASTVDENLTVYLNADSEIWSVAAGVPAPLPGSSTAGGSTLSVDGAGNIFVSNVGSSYGRVYSLNTDSERDIDFYIPGQKPLVEQSFAIATGSDGTLYVADPGEGAGAINGFIAPELLVAQNYGVDLSNLNQTPTTVFYTPGADIPSFGPTGLVADSYQDLFASGGNGLFEICPLVPAIGSTCGAAGTMQQIDTTGDTINPAVDAAGTLYLPRYGSHSGVVMLPASNYSQPEASLDGGGPLGNSVGPDGTVYIGNYGSLDIFNRSQGSIDWGSNNGQVSNPQTITVYNGGNEPLTLSSIAIAGPGYTIGSSTDPCTNGIVLAPGALCAIPIASNPPHDGTLSGALTIASNSLNNPSTVQTVALTGYVSGIYVTADPNSLAFGSLSTSQTERVTLKNYSAGSNSYGYGSSVSIASPLVSSNPAFSASVGNCPSSLDSGSSCQIQVTFTPTAGQSPSGTITWTEQITGGGPSQQLSVAVSGTGVPANIPEADSESIHVSDSVSLVPSTLLTIGESITVTDNPVETPSTLLPIGETITVTDKPVEIPSTLLPIGETITVTDKPVAIPSTLLPIGETITVTDTPGLPNPTTTKLSITPETLTVGQNITYRATVTRTAGPAGTPTGMVTFTNGIFAIGTYPLVNGVASVTLPLQALSDNGTYTVTAMYSGDTLDSPSSGTATFTIDTPAPFATSTAVAINPPNETSSNVTFSAMVSRTSGWAGIPTGTVTFNYGGTHVIGTYPLGSDGIASVTVTSASTHPYAASTVVAKYNGDSEDLTSTGSANLTVPSNGPYPTVTTLALSPASAVRSQSVTANVTVARAAGPSGTPTGKVTFTWGGTYLIGTATLSGGVATFTMPVQSTAPDGTYDVFATYTGDTDDNPSSDGANLTITPTEP